MRAHYELDRYYWIKRDGIECEKSSKDEADIEKLINKGICIKKTEGFHEANIQSASMGS